MSKLPIPFDNPTTYAGHSGIDYPQPRGTIFRASGPGTVTTLGRNTGGGFYIWVDYDDGPEVGYHHMDSHNGCPARWARVDEGTPLGYVGNTGNSTGPHLHSEVSGAATTAGYWRYFDRTTIVSRSGGGAAASSSPIVIPRSSDMIPMYITDDVDGNGKPGWALFNDRTGKWIYHVNNGTDADQAVGDGWSRSTGRNATRCTRQDALDLADAILKTT